MIKNGVDRGGGNQTSNQHSGGGGRAVRLKKEVPFLTRTCGLYFCILWCKLPAGVDNLSSSEAFQYVSERMKFEEGGGGGEIK